MKKMKNKVFYMINKRVNSLRVQIILPSSFFIFV